MTEFEEVPLSNATDIMILMHRDVHFGGQFDVMIEYYEKDGKGILQEFEVEQIVALQEMEKRLNKNLAALMLSGADADRVAKAKEAYKKLRNLYSKDKKEASTKSKIPMLIADLILAEEEMPEQEINAIVAEKSSIVPALIELLRAEDFYDPLFPGYGLAPALAIKCLAKIADKRAIFALFELIGEADFFSEDIALEALHAIGAPAKEFLLHVLHAKPLNFDNERAAIALCRFREDPEVAETCFKMLHEIDLKQHNILAEYLVLACEGLTAPNKRKEFIALADKPTIPKTLQQDIRSIASQW